MENVPAAQPPQPTPPHSYRVSDADREQVAELLRQAAGDGRLSLDELEERLEEAYGAKTYAELEPITRDLPVHASQRPVSPVSHPAANTARVGGTAPDGSIVAVLGGAERKGSWVVPKRLKVRSLLGGVDLDLREATLAAPEVVIDAATVLGGVDITVPLDVHVVVDGSGILGGFDESTKRGTPPPPPGAPVVRVRGMALLGGVTVKRRPPRKDLRDRLRTI